MITSEAKILPINQHRAKYVWDDDLTQDEFDRILAGDTTDGVVNRDWAAVRLIEYAPYDFMIRHIGYAQLFEN